MLPEGRDLSSVPVTAVTGYGARGDETPCMTTNRVTTSIPVEFQAGGNRATGKITNLGSGGLFVGSGTIPDQGEPVSLRFSLPGEAPIAMTALVWWNTNDQGSRIGQSQGFGLRFLEENEAYDRAIGRLLA